MSTQAWKKRMADLFELKSKNFTCILLIKFIDKNFIKFKSGI